MEKMEIEREALYLKAVEARSTCEECEEYGHVQDKPRFTASLPRFASSLYTIEGLYGRAI
jgi:hypothetical protein